MCGCSKNKPEEATPLTIYEQLKITDKSLSEADTGVIQEGITNWVKSFLAISSDTRDKEAINKGLYQSIANKEQKEKLKQDRESFYKDSVVIIEAVSYTHLDVYKRQALQKHVIIIYINKNKSGKFLFLLICIHFLML